MRRGIAIAAALIICLATADGLHAADHFLTIGGGYSPQGNQVSLEKNTLFFQQLLTERYPSGVSHTIFFSDGESPDRDVQFDDPAANVPRANQLLAMLNNAMEGFGHQYRTHQVGGISGQSSIENLKRWFQESGAKLPANDRLIIYLTGHGGKGDDPQNPHFYLWNHEEISVQEFVKLLDQLPAELRVVLVMVQCYSGGFANTIFQDGQTIKGLSGRNRCGFFATVHDRSAAGCTPDIAEENYHEYSTYFWAAVRGRSRADEPILGADYDHDGVVSFAEAHAYTLLTSDTIDISVKTSDAFLRKFSGAATSDAADVLTVDAPYSAILVKASPLERAVLDGLSSQLELDGQTRGKSAHELAEKIEKQRRDLERQRRRLDRPFHKTCEHIRSELERHWPESVNRWNPQVSELLRDEGPSIVTAVEGHSDYSEFKRLKDEMSSLADQRLILERKWAKCQRFLRALENVALADNLTRVAPPDVIRRYQELVAAEGTSLPSP